MLRLLKYTVRTNFLQIMRHGMMKKEKEFHTNFVLTPQTAKIMATIYAKYIVNMENSLNYRIDII